MGENMKASMTLIRKFILSAELHMIQVFN